VGTHVWWSVPQECNTTNRDRGTGWGLYRLGDVCGKGHVITEDWIVIAGAGIDVVTCHMIVTVVTIPMSLNQSQPRIFEDPSISFW
jgi:hypothetical protein